MGTNIETKMNLKREFPALVRRFQAIAPNVTTEDVMTAGIEMGCYYVTIERYLRGGVAKEKFAIKLLSFLESRIEERRNHA